jgi:hypothetical protein
MKKNLLYPVLPMLFAFFSMTSSGQNYTFEDFVGTWQGTIYTNYSGTLQMTMTIYEDGFYTENTGLLMPSLYPNTQQCEYLVSSNRMHWWYLGTAWGGQLFYEHHFYEVVSFENGVLEMHYNYWDDPIPNPQVGAIYLVKVTSTPAPVNIGVDIINDIAVLTWDEPDNGGNPVADLLGYNVYVSYNDGEYEFLAFTEETSFPFDNGATAGMNSYYVTAVFDEGESFPSDEIAIVFDTPEPEMLSGDPLASNIELNWMAPNPDNTPMATLVGYNVFHKYENEDFELVAFVDSTNFTHENLMNGSHYYYITAVYDGGESDPSNEVEVTLITTSVSEGLSVSAKVFPNPSSDFIFIENTENVRRITLTNQAGQIMLEIVAPQSNKQIDVSSIASGLYILTIETSKGLTTKKLMIQ